MPGIAGGEKAKPMAPLIPASFRAETFLNHLVLVLRVFHGLPNLPE